MAHIICYFTLLGPIYYIEYALACFFCQKYARWLDKEDSFAYDMSCDEIKYYNVLESFRKNDFALTLQFMERLRKSVKISSDERMRLNDEIET